MTRAEHNLAIALIANPPAGSKLAAAKEYGVDLTLLVENLQLTTTERIRKLQSAAEFLEKVRHSVLLTR
jgi:hypothetical protein